MKERISVIIPVYNVEKYVATCLDSLLSQTYQNFEIILIDDGSEDGSLHICREYEKQDSRIRVFHQENQGVSSARNFALGRMTGEYVTFIDPDDYVKEDYLEVLFRDMVMHEADVVCCNMIELMDNQVVHINKPRVLRKRVLNHTEDIYSIIATREEFFWNSACMALIKASWIENCRFRKLKFGEDQAFMYDLLTKRPVVYVDTYEGYFYIRHSGSATMSEIAFSISRGKNDVTVAEHRYKTLPDVPMDIRISFFQMYAMSVHVLVHRVVMAKSVQERRENHEYVCSKIKDCFQHEEWIPKKIKPYMKLYLRLPEIYRVLLIIKHAIGKLRPGNP